MCPLIDGTVRIDRGFVRAKGEPVVEQEETADDGEEAAGSDTGDAPATGPDGPIGPGAGGEDAEEEGLKPLPERIVSDLTAWRTLALQDAFAQNPRAAFASVLGGYHP